MVKVINKVDWGTIRSSNCLLWADDILKFLKKLPMQEIFDFVVTSPPYNLNKEYEKNQDLETYITWQSKIIGEIVPRVKYTGSICWQIGTYVKKGSIIPLDILLHPIFYKLDLKLRNRIIWHFGHGLHSKKRLSGRYETVLWYTKSDKYTFNLDSIRIPSKNPRKKYYKGPNKGKISSNPLGKNPSDVWDIPNVKWNHVEKTIHPCQFPIGLIERLVLAFTNENQLVLDPFCGVASSGVASLIHNRRFWGCEINKEYIPIAKERLEKTLIKEIRYQPYYIKNLENKENKFVKQ